MVSARQTIEWYVGRSGSVVSARDRQSSGTWGRSGSVVNARDRQLSGTWGAVAQWLMHATDNRVVRGAQWLSG